MKSNRIIYILFLVFCMGHILKINANNDVIKISTYKNKQKDSLNERQTLQNENNAKSIVRLYEEKEEQSEQYSNKDLKKLTLSYAQLKNNKKANEYLSKYIKSTYDRGILTNPVLENIKDSKEFKVIENKYKPEINGWIIFFLSSGFIGIFIAIVLNLRKNTDRSANILIGSFVLIHSLFVIHLSMFLSKYGFNFPHSLYFTTSFSLLYGPLLYFYLKRITTHYKFKYIDLLHLIPTVGLILFFLPIYILPSEEKLRLLFNRDEILHNVLVAVVILKYISLIVYGLLIIKNYLVYSRQRDRYHPEIFKWLKSLVILNSVYIVAYIIYGLALMNIVTSYLLIYPQIVMMCFIVLYVGYGAYVQPVIFSKKYLFVQDLHKYQKSGLTESFSNDLKKQLLHLLNEEKIYKINNISLDMLSERLGTTRHNISQVINEHFDVNFFNLINKYRILEAQEIFQKDEHNNLHIIDVAYDVGFNNKVTFNKAFKEETKLTPTQFLQKNNDDKRYITSA